jgi:hypothetical protein
MNSLHYFPLQYHPIHQSHRFYVYRGSFEISTVHNRHQKNSKIQTYIIKSYLALLLWQTSYKKFQDCSESKYN